MEIKKILLKGKEILDKAGIEDSDNDSRYIFKKLFNRDDLFILMNGNMEMCGVDENIYYEYINNRAKHIPVQELFHEAYFFGRVFKINDDVLTPRLETELVLNEAIEIISKGNISSILDLCTGSGILGITLKKEFPNLDVTLSDISEEALVIAKENAALNMANVKILRSDMFNEISSKYDMIISNPPYIREEDLKELSPEVLEHDPRIALVGGSDGLKFYREIAKDGCNHLNSSGVVVLEIGYDQGECVKELFLKAGYSSSYFKKDFSGNDRIVVASV